MIAYIRMYVYVYLYIVDIHYTDYRCSDCVRPRRSTKQMSSGQKYSAYSGNSNRISTEKIVWCVAFVCICSFFQLVSLIFIASCSCFHLSPAACHFDKWQFSTPFCCISDSMSSSSVLSSVLLSPLPTASCNILTMMLILYHSK